MHSDSNFAVDVFLVLFGLFCVLMRRMLAKQAVNRYLKLWRCADEDMKKVCRIGFSLGGVFFVIFGILGLLGITGYRD